MNQTKIVLDSLYEKALIAGQMIQNYPDPNNLKVTFPPSPYYRFLKMLAEYMGSRLSVELGVCGGGGSLHLAMGSQIAVGVDITLDYHDNIRWIKRHYPNFHFRNMDSVKSAKEIYMAFGEIDLLFIDTTHTYYQTMAEYNAFKPFLSGNAIVCLDDLFRQGMDRAWKEMPDTKIRYDRLHPSQSPTDGGFGVVWK